jgi:hypothetical protein
LLPTAKWQYRFFESSKSTSKTVAKNAEQQRRRELEAGYNNIRDVRIERVRPLEEVITD